MSASANQTGLAEPIRYRIRFSAPQTHYAEIEAWMPVAGHAEVELVMPVWTPGSYLVREYARHLEELSVTGFAGKPLELTKVRKNRWRVRTDESAEITVKYRVYSRTMSVQGNWVDASFALLNGAATFLTLAGEESRRHEVQLVLPAGWRTSVTGLPEAPDHAAHRYLAADFDTLVDSPIYAGSPAIYEFNVDGVPHFLVNEGEGGLWDGPRSARDVDAIIRTQKAFWGSLPYKKYVFFNLLTENGGGLEHRNSTVLMASRWATRTRAGYLSWLNLVSHEFFHTWNVKRLRPIELGPFDYENEVYTPSLWVAEGITSYYDRLLVRRAGFCTLEEYLAGDPPSGDSDKPLSDIERLQTTPGRLVQTLEASSYDAWIKLYRRDENTPNSSISYYIKGAVVAFLLDAKIRRLTGGKKSLDDVMRLAYDRYSGPRGFTTLQFQRIAQEVAGIDLSDWFHLALQTTEELDYTEALDTFGLRFASDEKKKTTKELSKPLKAWLGLVTKNEDGNLVITQVKRGTPGFEAGFNVGDEVLAIGEDRVHASDWSKRMECYQPGEKVSILIARRKRLQRLDAVFGVEPPRQWTLELNPDATGTQKAQRKAWIGE